MTIALAERPVRPVLVVLAPLVQDDLALRLEFLHREGRQQIAHPIGFHPQRQVQRVRGNDLPVVGAIGIRRSVQRRAGFLQRMEVALVVMLRAFEHEMFEQVREPGAPRKFVLRSDVIPEIHRHHRQPAILVDDHAQAVLERVLSKWNIHEW